MDLHLEPEEAAFRAEFLAWLGEVTPPEGLRDYGSTPTAEDLPAARAWQRMLHDAGWAGLSWPKEHGGRGATVTEQAIFAEEMARAGLPRQLNLVGFELAGPMLIAYGTAAQQQRFLGPLLRGEEIWCQLFSEPGAGSDLAGLTSRAVPQGSGWAVTGQKVWTSGAHYSDFGLLLARTGEGGSRHEGITCFVLPMGREGIDIRPLRQMDGEAKFNEVFLDGARVEEDEVLGEGGRGWRVAISTLGRERRTLGAQAVQMFDALQELAAHLRGMEPVQAALHRDAWVELWGRVRALRLTWLRALSVEGADSDPRMSVLKLAASELERDLTAFAAEVLGSSLLHDPRWSAWQKRFLAAPGGTLAGGSSEIQRTILAERVLGLPRARR